jgi:rhodanese-related sulfurtransferase
MTTLTPIDAQTVAARLKTGAATLIDIREADEYAREHIASAVSLPLSKLEQGRLAVEAHGNVVFHCKSGMRTSANCVRLAAHVDGEAYMLEGGLDGWRRAGLPVYTNPRAPLELNRQVQIAVGALILLGVLLTTLVNANFVLLPAVFGAGLLFAGVSGWCGMAHLLSAAPWNRRRAE